MGPVENRRKRLEMKVLGNLKKVAARLNEERGATAVEYALIIGLVAVAIIAAVTALGGNIDSIIDSITAALPG